MSEMYGMLGSPNGMSGYATDPVNPNYSSGMTEEERQQLNKNTSDISKLKDDVGDALYIAGKNKSDISKLKDDVGDALHILDIVEDKSDSLSEEIENLRSLIVGSVNVNIPLLVSILRNAKYVADVSDKIDQLAGGGSDTPITPDEPSAPTLQSISVAYNGGDVDAGTSVDDLTGIVVTAHMSDGTSHAVSSGWYLIGEILVGVNTISVHYEGKSATFTVTGNAVASGISGFAIPVSNLNIWEKQTDSVWNTGYGNDQNWHKAWVSKLDATNAPSNGYYGSYAFLHTLHELSGTVYIRMASNNEYGLTDSRYPQVLLSDTANLDDATALSFSTPIKHRNCATVEISGTTYYIHVWEYTVPTGKIGYVAYNGLNNQIFFDASNEYNTVFFNSPLDDVLQEVLEV